MRQWIMLGLALLLLLPASGNADPVQDLIAKIKAKYGAAKDFTADFEQVTTLRQMGGRQKKASGTIYIARPNRLRWEYKKPTQRQILSDGNSLVFYYVEEKKAYLTSTGSEFDITQPLRILSGEIDLIQSYQAEVLPDLEGRARLKLTPRRPAGYSFILLHINRNTSLVEVIETEDAYGNNTRLTLSNQRFNSGLAESLFVFVPRAGIQILDAPMMDFDH